MAGLLWRFVERRLERTLPAAHAASTIGDLAEDYLHRIETLGRLRARVWLVREAWSLNAVYRRAAPAGARPPRMLIEAEIRAAVRRLSSRPGPSIACACLLGAGIGLCTAAFSVVDAVMLRPSPFRDADRLVQQQLGYSEPALMEAWRASGVFEQVEASRETTIQLSAGPDARSWPAAEVTPGIFEMLGIRPARGRAFVSGGPVAGDEVLISEVIWRTMFAADPTIVGRTLATDRGTVVVVGVMPASFQFPTPSSLVWRPFRPAAREQGLFTIHGRLRPGVSVNAGLAGQLKELAVAHARLPRNYIGPPLDRTGEPDISGVTANGLWLLLAGAALAFIVSCANVFGLVRSNLAVRRREFGTCIALGASRARLLREAFLEHAFVGLAAFALGVWVAYGLTAMVPSVFQGHTLNPIDVDPRALLAAGGLGLMALLFAGVLPAWLGTRADPVHCFRTHHSLVPGDSSLARVARSGLLVAEVALATSLLTGAGVLIRSFVNLASVNRGMSADDISRVRITRLDDVFSTGTEMRQAATDIEARLRAWGAIDGVALSREIPPLPGHATAVAGDEGVSVDAERYRVGVNYFELYGIAIRRGRPFRPGDGVDTVVVSERLAEQLWPGRDAVGRFVSLRRSPRPLEVIGVTGEVRLPSLDARLDLPEFYTPLGIEARTLYLNFRCRGACPGIAEIQARVREVHPLLEARAALPAENAYVRQLMLPKAMAGIGGLFTVVAIICAAGGLFSALTYSVGLRRHEFGVRAAMGASPRQIRRLVLKDSALVVASGVLWGAVGGWSVARSLAAFHYGVSSADPVTAAAVVVTIAATALMAAALPARRAARADPAALLRSN
jgi:putative ABC transport system permease protein